MEGQRLDPADVHHPQPAAHLPGRPGGERHGQHLTGGDVTIGDQVGDAVGDGAGLAGTGPGQHADRAAGGQDGLALFVIETDQMVSGYRHGVHLRSRDRRHGVMRQRVWVILDAL